MDNFLTNSFQNVLGSKFQNVLHFKDQIPKDLISDVVYKFQCGLCNESYYGECMRHLNVRIGEHIGILPLTIKKVKPRKSSVAVIYYFAILNIL